MRPIAKICLAPALLLLLLGPAGCLKVGPDHAVPDLPDPAPREFQQAAGQGLQDPAAPWMPQDRWWETFHKPEMNRMVEESLERNLDLAKASARVEELLANFTEARAGRYPALNLSAEGARKRTGYAVGTPLASGGETDSFNLAAAASFEIDIWGRLARTEEASRGDLLAAEETRWATAQTVAGSVISSYLNIEALERRLAVNQRSIRAYRVSLDVVEGRYRRGLSDILALKQATRALAEAEAQTPSLILELGRAQQSLAVLLGRYPKTSPAKEQPEDYFPRLDPVPPGLPSQLLSRRPDVRSAEASLLAANARIGAFKAARFPTLTLTGSYGYASSDLEKLVTPEGELWNISAGILAPLFDAGLRESRQRAAEARWRSQVATWGKTVLTAFQEVEESLLTRKEQMERRQRVLWALEEARATQEAAQSRYLRGLTDYLSVLEAQQTRFRLEDTLVLTELSVLTNRVTLHRALGGGWAEPPALTPLASRED